jgi:hypothetical protein
LILFFFLEPASLIALIEFTVIHRRRLVVVPENTGKFMTVTLL